MDFESIFTDKRIGSDNNKPQPRSGFQRDFDRLIFSSPFRRLQNKTQVFPLPGRAFVHNRLTHSLEAASVGRSLGKMIGEEISNAHRNQPEVQEFYRYELANVIAAACLAHDIGNPAFGHSGEKAISAYFLDHAGLQVEGTQLRSFFSDAEWRDLTSFEGNANALRILTHGFRGRFTGGLGLTYTTVASIMKYPCEASAVNKTFKHRKKYGFFQTEKDIVPQLAAELSLIKESDAPLCYKRHPFVYIVEAADDICYSVVDMEDAHRLGILRTDEIEEAFMNAIKRINAEQGDKTYKYYKAIGDVSEAIAFLRARIINLIVLESTRIFLDHKEQIITGNFNQTLLGFLENETRALEQIQDISLKKIYGHETVIQVEIAGFNVMSFLLGMFVPALLKSQPTDKEAKVLQLFPYQFTEFRNTISPYQKVMSALDFISGMTDEYATEIYRRLKGIVIPEH